jgi:hypothetical protein
LLLFFKKEDFLPSFRRLILSITHQSAIKATNGLYFCSWLAIMGHETRWAEL